MEKALSLVSPFSAPTDVSAQRQRENWQWS